MNRQQELDSSDINDRTLLEIYSCLTGTLSLEVVVQQILFGVRRVVACDSTAVWLLLPQPIYYRNKSAVSPQIDTFFEEPPNDSYLHKVKQTRQPLILSEVDFKSNWPNNSLSEPIRSVVGMPIIVANECIAVLILESEVSDSFRPDHIELCTTFCHFAGIGLKNALDYETACINAIREERLQFVQRLHDTVSQNIYAANTMVELLPRVVQKDPQKSQAYMVDLAQLTQAAMADVRNLMVELHPEGIKKTELNQLIKQLCDSFASRYNFSLIFKGSGKLFLSAEAQHACYRIVQEALQNVANHAQATEVVVKLTQQKNSLELIIEDDGIGFNLQEIPLHATGIRKIQTFGRNIGSNCIVNSRPEIGTTITVKNIKI